MEYLFWNHNQINKTFNTFFICWVLIFIYCRKNASVFFSSPSALVRLYQHVQHRRQCLSKFISPYSKTVSLCQTFSVPSVLISNCLSLSVRTAQSVSLCQTFSVTSAQYQYLSKFVSEKGDCQYFSDLVVFISIIFSCQYIQNSIKKIKLYIKCQSYFPLRLGKCTSIMTS